MKLTDQLGRQVVLPGLPKRIITLVPSQTELLSDLGLEEEVVGITKFCIHPSRWATTKIKVGGTKRVNLEVVKNLHPDLVIANKEENEKKDLEELSTHCPVWISDVKNTAEAFGMIRSVGVLTGKQDVAEILLREIESETAHWSGLLYGAPIRAAYLIWKDPLMVAASGTFVDSMMQLAGFRNVFAHRNRYPQITMEILVEAAPEVVLLSSEPFPFSQKHVDNYKHQLPKSQVILVDGAVFSWYGSRMKMAPSYFHVLRRQCRV